jgi:hypothetical protein
MTQPLNPDTQKQGRDPEDRRVDPDSQHQKREKTHDKTLADSFPTSDPPSTIPDPEEGDLTPAG